MSLETTGANTGQFLRHFRKPPWVQLSVPVPVPVSGNVETLNTVLTTRSTIN